MVIDTTSTTNTDWKLVRVGYFNVSFRPNNPQYYILRSFSSELEGHAVHKCYLCKLPVYYRDRKSVV